MERLESFDLPEDRQKLREWIREALPITGWLIGYGPRSSHAPVVAVAMRGRSDVQDLARVHLQEGPAYEGDVWSQWMFVTGQQPVWALLDIQVRKPVRCDFKLAFRLDKHRLVLKAAATSGLVGIALKPLRMDARGMVYGPMLFIETRTSDLRRVLKAAVAVESEAGQTITDQVVQPMPRRRVGS